MSEQHIVRFWRGKRATYEYIKNQDKIDFWTRYSIIEPDGSITEVFGNDETDNRILSVPTGQILPVASVVTGSTVEEALAKITAATTGERYLVGRDDDLSTTENECSYYVYIVTATTDKKVDESKSAKFKFTSDMSVRVADRGYKTYQLVDGILTTYDDVDCGMW